MPEPEAGSSDYVAYHHFRAEQEMKRAEVSNDAVIISLHTELSYRHLELAGTAIATHPKKAI